MSVLHLPITADVLLLYPGESLKDQIGLWTMRHPERRVEMSCGWSLPEMRALLHDAGAVLVDATENPARASDGFLQAVARIGAGAVVMYTERMHDALELLVRTRGSLFLLGPLLDEQWEDCLQRLLERKRTAKDRRTPALRRGRLSRWSDREMQQRARLVHRFRRGFDWTATDMN